MLILQQLILVSRIRTALLEYPGQWRWCLHLHLPRPAQHEQKPCWDYCHRCVWDSFSSLAGFSLMASYAAENTSSASWMCSCKDLKLILASGLFKVLQLEAQSWHDVTLSDPLFFFFKELLFCNVQYLNSLCSLIDPAYPQVAHLKPLRSQLRSLNTRLFGSGPPSASSVLPRAR